MTDGSSGDVESHDSVVGAIRNIFAGLPRARVDDDTTRDPSTIGRYRVVHRVGSGAMGVVYAAYDEDLDRRVAIKLVRGRAAQGSARLRREAQALARISHPNVIGVHEVGVHTDEQVFIAMEFVRGETLRQWCSASTRTHREVLDVLLQAGRGLAAVHEAGLVHRDVKPENVMIGDDGRVRLMDFGLARGDAREGTLVEDTPERSTSRDGEITRPGAIAGTPAYMAPEQWSGGDIGMAADQFAFCVMAWEAFYRARPFAGTSVDALARTITAGQRREPPRASSVSTRVRRVLERGLALAPADRWPSMGALLDALARGSRRRLAAGIAAGVIASAAILAGTRTQSVDCRERVDAVAPWHDGARADVRRALTSASLPYAEATATRVEQGLDAYAAQLSSTQVEACEGTGAELTVELRTARALCLEQRRQGLAALVEVLVTGEPAAIERAPQAVESLAAIEPCNDVASLGARVPPPDDPVLAARVEDVRTELARVRALESAGLYADALAAAQAAFAEAEAIGDAPLRAEAVLELGRQHAKSGNHAEAETHLREAHAAALVSRDDDTAMKAAIQLVHTLGVTFARFDAALEWAAVASAEVERTGENPAAQARLAQHLGAVHSARGAYDEAILQLQRAIDLQEHTFGEDGILLASMLDDLGGAYRLRGDVEDALAAFQRSIALRERTLGPAHPGLGVTLTNLAVLEMTRGNVDRAIELGEQVLGILEPALGPDHDRVALSMSHLGVYKAAAGDLDGALALQRRALATFERTFGQDHARTAATLEYIANIHHARGELAEELPLYERVLAIREKTLGPEHHDVAITLDNLGNHSYERNEYARALELYTRALTIRERAFGSEHRLVADSLESVGIALQGLEQFAAAEVKLARCLELRMRLLGPDHPQVGHAHTNLGNGAEAQGDYPRAIEHFEKALTAYATLGEDHLQVALGLYNLAQTRLAQGKPELAIPDAERSLSIRERGGVGPLYVADTKFLLAQALSDAGRDRRRARQLAEEARAAYRPVDHARYLADRVDAWLRTHR